MMMRLLLAAAALVVATAAPAQTLDDRYAALFGVIVEASSRCPGIADTVGKKQIEWAAQMWSGMSLETRNRVARMLDARIKEIGVEQFCAEAVRMAPTNRGPS